MVAEIPSGSSSSSSSSPQHQQHSSAAAVGLQLQQQQQLKQENVAPNGSSNSNGTIQRTKTTASSSSSSAADQCPTPTTSQTNSSSSSILITQSTNPSNPAITPLGDAGNNSIELKTENLKNLEFCLCTACGQPIQDRYIYKVLDNQFYHEKCLCCSVCAEPFLPTAGSCFARNASLFCRDHFIATFGPKCSRCSAPIGERTIVRRANQHIYHLDCFQCIVCKRELNTGDQFYLIPMDGRLVCRQDFENAQKESSEMDCGNKRPRTTISAKSLDILKQAYQLSSKPARHVREQLAQQTGLDMRVVQVWFQNRRAKEKRLKKDANRRWAAAQAAGGHLPNGQQQPHSMDANGTGMRSSSNGDGGSGPGSVPSSIGGAGGLQMLFGRNGTFDSDSGASNNDADSPTIYSIYPSDVSEDVNSSNEFYPDQNCGGPVGGGSGIFLPTSSADSIMGGQQQMPNDGQMATTLLANGGNVPQQSPPPHAHHQTSPQLQQEQLFALEHLANCGGGGDIGQQQQQEQQQQQPKTPIAGGPMTTIANQIATISGMMGIGTGNGIGIGGIQSAADIPSQQRQLQQQQQQNQLMNGTAQMPLFSPQQMMTCAAAQNGANGGMLTDQQQYLLATFGPPPPQMDQFMMGAIGAPPLPPPPPDASSSSSFYGHPPPQHVGHPSAADLVQNMHQFSPISMHNSLHHHHHFQQGQQHHQQQQQQQQGQPIG